MITVTSFYFFVLLAVGVLAYYVVPKKCQWMVLLAISVVFYVFAATPYTLIFLIASTVVTYVDTMLMQKLKPGTVSKGLTIVTIVAVLFNVALWFLLKGSSFWILGSDIVRHFAPTVPRLKSLPLVGALGMGYYTAQIIGYILDVSWGNAKVQKNPIKLFLFICFFPQLTVGPISRYNDLKTLYEGHAFSYTNLCFGTQRIVWGLFKKLVISDRTGLIVNGIWDNAEYFGGQWFWLAVFLYPLQIYTDFSGCMDIVLGAAELFDVHLAENFRNPFFAKSSQEFWQRWHITLGTWARDYVYYPVLKSKFLVNLGKKCKKKYGKRIGKFIPWAVGMGILWFVMGFWHGSVQHIFGVSLWFWTMLVLSELCKPLTDKMLQVFHIKTKTLGWHIFQSVRTYIVYAVGAVFFSAVGLRGAFYHFKLLFTSFAHIHGGAKTSVLMVTGKDVGVIVVGAVILFVADVLREKYEYTRYWVAKRCFVIRWLIWLVLFFAVLVLGLYGIGYDASSFIYQGF